MTYDHVLSGLLLNFSEKDIKHIKELIEDIEQQLISYRKRAKNESFITSLGEVYETKQKIEMLQNRVDHLMNLWDSAHKQILFEILNER